MSKEKSLSTKCEEAYVEIKGRTIILRTERGALALIPEQEICEVARRFNLCIKNYKCP